MIESDPLLAPLAGSVADQQRQPGLRVTSQKFAHQFARRENRLHR